MPHPNASRDGISLLALGGSAALCRGEKPLVSRPDLRTRVEHHRRERMLHDGVPAQKVDNAWLGAMQVIDPHRRFDENHVSGDIALARSGGRFQVAPAEQGQPSRNRRR